MVLLENNALRSRFDDAVKIIDKMEVNYEVVL
jgi:hypothetical protein